MNKALLDDIHLLLQSIKKSPMAALHHFAKKDSIYLPKLSVERVDTIAEKVENLLKDKEIVNNENHI